MHFKSLEEVGDWAAANGGETAVREALAAQRLGPDPRTRGVALEWLRRQDARREAYRLEQAVAQAQQTLVSAERAASAAEQSARWTKIAALATAAAAIFTALAAVAAFLGVRGH